MIPICPITKGDILHAEDIFGTDVGSLQGKTTRKKTNRVATTIIYLPTGMLEQHGNVTIEMDIMYINKVPYFVMTLHGIHFGTVELLKNKKVATIATSMKQMLQMYHRRGFKVKHLHGDGQFEHIRKFFSDMDINLNTTR